MPRFVILSHDHPFPHWDLMLEHQNRLVTWRLPSLLVGEDCLTAEKLSDHRLGYLDYEGPVSGDRGTVARWDAGRYQLLDDSGPEWNHGSYMVRLEGTQCCGWLQLNCNLEGEPWELQWMADTVAK